MIIDATDLVAGRLASFAAKQAMMGNNVDIINSEKAIISGKKSNTFDQYLELMKKGTPVKGPFLSRMPHRLLKRMVRGMLPYKKPRGKDAYKKIMCYVGVPEKFEGKKAMTVEDAHVSKLPTLKYVDLKTLSRRLGAKIE